MLLGPLHTAPSGGVWGPVGGTPFPPCIAAAPLPAPARGRGGFSAPRSCLPPPAPPMPISGTAEESARPAWPGSGRRRGGAGRMAADYGGRGQEPSSARAILDFPATGPQWGGPPSFPSRAQGLQGCKAAPNGPRGRGIAGGRSPGGEEGWTAPDDSDARGMAGGDAPLTSCGRGRGDNGFSRQRPKPNERAISTSGRRRKAGCASGPRTMRLPSAGACVKQRGGCPPLPSRGLNKGRAGVDVLAQRGEDALTPPADFCSGG